MMKTKFQIKVLPTFNSAIYVSDLSVKRVKEETLMFFDIFI
jgi:hypothetical protein